MLLLGQAKSKRRKHNEFGLGWYSFDLRAFNPVIARWHNADPFNQYSSPYIAMGNNPVNMIDPNGGESEGANNICKTWEQSAKELSRMHRNYMEGVQESYMARWGHKGGGGASNVGHSDKYLANKARIENTFENNGVEGITTTAILDAINQGMSAGVISQGIKSGLLQDGCTIKDGVWGKYVDNNSLGVTGTTTTGGASFGANTDAANPNAHTNLIEMDGGAGAKWKSLDMNDALSNISSTVTPIMLDDAPDSFHGTDINYDSWAVNDAAYTLPGLGGVYMPKGNTPYPNWIAHEYGHILQAKLYGYDYYYKVIVPSSVISQTMQSIFGDKVWEHKSFWAETNANFLSKIVSEKYIVNGWDENFYPTK